MGNWRRPGLRRSQTTGLWIPWPLLEEVTSVLISKSVPRRREKERVEVAHLKSPWHSKWAPYACQQVTQRERRTRHRAGAWVTGSPFTKRCKEKEFPFMHLKISQSLPINLSINRSFNQSLFHLLPFARVHELEQALTSEHLLLFPRLDLALTFPPFQTSGDLALTQLRQILWAAAHLYLPKQNR